MKGLIALFVLGIVLYTEAQPSETRTCPNVSEDPLVDVLIPHESICSKFYKCSLGEKVLQDCPGDLHFNSKTKECDWPDSANCENGNIEGEDNDENDEENSEGGDGNAEDANNNNNENICPLVVEDPEEDILFAHESDCTKFYKCSHGEKVLQECPDGLHYNPQQRYCDWPESANCSTNNSTIESGKDQDENNNENTCPSVVEDPEIDILFPHESNCNKFYKCSHGEKVLMDCPSGLHFNSKTNECDWPHSANCGNGNTEGEDNDDNGGDNENTCPSVVEDPEEDILFAHESDCTKFYKCSHGEKVLLECPDGLHYNPEQRYCDWPESANCSTNNSTLTPIESGEDKDENNNENTCPSVVEDPEIDILFPHESDCNKFYKCSLGEKVLQECPDGLHYNPEQRYCDWPENANCSTNNSTLTSPIESDEERDENNIENTCPSVGEDPEEDILFAHESDCTKFYKCSLGEKVLQECADGLHYNPEQRYCDWPESANCSTNNSTLTSPIESGEDRDGNNNENTCPSVGEDPEEDILFAHESDCTKFYKCSGGEKVLQACPDGLHYNPKQRYCDWPESANCSTNNSTLTSPIESDEQRDENNNENTCPSLGEDPEEDILFAHESDCTKFYKCSLGEKILQECADGLHYNPEQRYCDWPESANCSTNNSTLTSPIESDEDRDQNNNENTCPSVGEDPEEDILFAHESDCTKFYKCSGGEKVLQECPDGLHYNPEQGYCDWPESANCSTNNSTLTSPIESDEDRDQNNNENTCPSVGEDPEEDILFAHESDCTKFYKCSLGEKVLQECADGLHYNPEQKYCDWPENANCSTNNSTLTSPIESGEDRDENNIENTCPSVGEDPEEDILFAHESDCTKFYKCSFGEKVLQECADGLHYNPEQKYCDWPENANCSTNNSTLTSPIESGEDRDENNIENTCPSVGEDPEEDILFAHESDCTKFYKCSGGEKVLQECPDGLHYNPKQRYCDWPESANCTNNSTLTLAEHQQILLPHETECSKFYLVFNDIPFEYNCPSGLYFNADLKACDYKSNVKCLNQSSN